MFDIVYVYYTTSLLTQSLYRCHDQTFSPEQSSTHRNRDHNYTTKVYEKPADYVHHKDVMTSDEFEDVCELIEANKWEYGGLVPLEDFESMRVRFALATDGKVITDYFTATEDEWDNRSNVHKHTMKSRVQTWMNELRLNHIKKGQKCCPGCGRDTQNKEPYKLGVSKHFEHIVIIYQKLTDTYLRDSIVIMVNIMR